MTAKRSDMKTFDCKDVRLVPKKNIVESRSHIIVDTIINNHTFKLPIIPANMSTIIDEKLAQWLAEKGYFYIMHRFDNDPVVFTENMHDKNLLSSISLGIQQKDSDIVDRFIDENIVPDFITIDVAHGHSDKVIRLIKKIKDNLPDVFVIAGNVGSVEGALELETAGADAIKAGIGGGSVCLTTPNTGFGTRDYQLSFIEEVAQYLKNAILIADGGIREFGDIAKTIALGADLVMVGGMFAGHDENPGDLIENEKGEKFKVFFGSASEFQKGEKKYVEGKKILTPYKGGIENTLQTIRENLQSAVSYAGGKTIDDLKNTEYVILK